MLDAIDRDHREMTNMNAGNVSLDTMNPEDPELDDPSLDHRDKGKEHDDYPPLKQEDKGEEYEDNPPLEQKNNGGECSDNDVHKKDAGDHDEHVNPAVIPLMIPNLKPLNESIKEDV